MKKRLALVAAAVALVIGAAVVWALTRSEDKPVAADVEAQRACRAFARFERLVGENASGDAVYDTLDELKRAATRAADADPRWRSLASGADALDYAFRQDNAQAARAGIDVTRGQCAFTQ